MSLAERHPELFGTKVVGAALISTTAGGLDIGRILFPLLPAGIGPGIVTRVVSTLSRGSGLVDRVRAVGRDVARVVVDTYAFGSDVPASYVDFTYDMLDKTPFSVVADFFPAFASLDHWTHLEPLVAGPDVGHLRHRATRSPASATAASCTPPSTAPTCWSAATPATWWCSRATPRSTTSSTTSSRAWSSGWPTRRSRAAVSRS